MRIGAPWELALRTFDKFGNARASGSEEVMADVDGPAGTQIQKASVTDRGNGCYSISFQPDREGRWLLNPRSIYMNVPHCSSFLNHVPLFAL